MTLIEENTDIEKKKKYRIPKQKEKEIRRTPCPQCGRTDMLRSQGRCVTCIACGWGTCNL